MSIIDVRIEYSKGFYNVIERHLGEINTADKMFHMDDTTFSLENISNDTCRIKLEYLPINKEFFKICRFLEQAKFMYLLVALRHAEEIEHYCLRFTYPGKIIFTVHDEPDAYTRDIINFYREQNLSESISVIRGHETIYEN